MGGGDQLIRVKPMLGRIDKLEKYFTDSIKSNSTGMIQ
ncbi:MAG: hypothetical protein ACI9KN_002015 [Gammaproteobacteria bacterium]|jgi:hypothetical protein